MLVIIPLVWPKPKTFEHMYSLIAAPVQGPTTASVKADSTLRKNNPNVLLGVRNSGDGPTVAFRNSSAPGTYEVEQGRSDYAGDIILIHAEHWLPGLALRNFE